MKTPLICFTLSRSCFTRGLLLRILLVCDPKYAGNDNERIESLLYGLGSRYVLIQRFEVEN